MAQDITLLGASYQAVPAVTLPKTGGGTASFTDVTDTTAAAADVATGKYFYTAAGVRTEGTSSGGGGGGDNLPDFLANTIVAVNLPTLTSFAKAYAFRASSVTSVVLTGLTSFNAGASVFQDSASLTVCVMPNIASVAINTSSTWNRCRSLAALDLGLWRFGGSEMASCSSLTTVILRPLQVLELVSTNAFNGTPFASDGTGGTLYVPQSLISSYQSATNWSTILGYANNSIKAIEGSQYENYYADGTPIS